MRRQFVISERLNTTYSAFMTTSQKMLRRSGRRAISTRYIHRIEQFCLGLRTFPQRGRSMRGTSGEVRVIVFERRIAITFHIDKDEVVILRILYGGRDLDAILSSL